MSEQKNGQPTFQTPEQSSSINAIQHSPSAPSSAVADSREAENNTVGSSVSHMPYTDPPPPYQSAMTYPAAPYGQPSVNPSFPPRPAPNYPHLTQPPVYYPTQPIGSNHVPHSEQIPIQQTMPPSAVVVTFGNGVPCTHCNVGVVTKETDMCCMLCLILLTIFTFPFGLVFLCCIPCAVSRRCSECRRAI